MSFTDHKMLTGDGSTFRDVLIECSVIPALLARISPDTPVCQNSMSAHVKHFHLALNQTALQ